MKFMLLVLAFSSEMALAAICGKASADVDVSGVGINFTAEDAKVDCEFTKSEGKLTGAFKVKLKELKSGMETRDDHMREALKVAEHPEATFKLSAWDMKSGEVSGDFTLNGVTKKVKWKAEVNGSSILVSGKLDYTDYGLPQAAYKKAGVSLATVDKVVGVRVEISI